MIIIEINIRKVGVDRKVDIISQDKIRAQFYYKV